MSTYFPKYYCSLHFNINASIKTKKKYFRDITFDIQF